MNNLLDASCRVAFAALIHDIGKFAERAKIELSTGEKESNQHIVCPRNENGYFTHTHAAYTGIAIDKIEQYLPTIKNGDTFPFQQQETDDSIIDAASKHHKPDTYLQRIITLADRLSSAFERDEYKAYNEARDKEDYQIVRLVPLFDEVNKKNITSTDVTYRYPLQPLCPASVFPAKRDDATKEQATAEYLTLWEAFVKDCKTLQDKDNWDLWLDHFDTLYSVYTQNIPSSTTFGKKGVVPDVSLYDHSKSTTALATALWQYHYETKTETKDALDDEDEQKFLLIQGDVSGIQSFIFDVGKETQKNAYKLLRGRSFLVSLFSECAALKVLQTLALPATSQIMNAAGKFIIVAPNTKETVDKIEAVKKELNAWFLNHYYGEVALGLATITACQADFRGKKFKSLQARLFQSLGSAKMHKFDLCNENAGIVKQFFDHYHNDKGICCYDGKMPATAQVPHTENDFACAMCLDVLKLGEQLADKSKCNLVIASSEVSNGLTTDIFGYYVGWQDSQDTLRHWDISLPYSDTAALFNGFARRNINAYVPRFEKEDEEEKDKKYKGLDEPKAGQIKTFSHLAVEDCIYDDGKLKTKPALISIKGDIDNLGLLFQSGIETPTFATVAGLSRQINNFFTVWLPYRCKEKFKNVYTVFAGGDDFFLIGPWKSQIEMLPEIKADFDRYVCHNANIHFSVGMSMTKSGENVTVLSGMSEDALEQAKKYPNKEKPTKNAVCLFGHAVSFADYDNLRALEHRLDDFKEKYDLSIGYIYGLLTLCEQAENADKPDNKNFTDALWRSKLVYRTTRFVEMSRNEDKPTAVKTLTTEIGKAIEQYKTAYKIALYTWLYQQREG